MRNLFVTFIFKIILFLNLWSSTSYSLINLQENSIVMTMMIRDEAVNIRSNLPLWKKFINYFIFMIDERTVDDTEDAIREILGKDCPYQLISYKFEGFGPARTLSLQNAWKYYPQATHVWIADPDWRPELDTMDKRDLDLIHDAFRFLIYDRNGLTTRRCDWLLRHRKGLAMRYHLHEVLDIGETYSPSPIKWVVREIEQKGSWHTTVGHGHSMSAARYKFDLELLEKDKLAYGHNPHTHHYLGITHEAYAEGLFKANGGKMTSEIQFHFDEAVKYFTKRITEVYEPEFMEERWACMFSLGALYFQYLNDPIRALRWFKACHDFSPQQTECAISMLSVYESLGVLNKVVETLQIILRTEHEERGMLNHFKHWICDVPTTAVRVMNYMDKIYKNLTVVDAKYMVLVAGIAQSKKCQEYGSTLSNDLVVAVREVARVNGIPSSFLSQYQLLCKDSDLQNYLLENKYQLHPCENVFHEYQRGKMCSDFDKELAAPVESLQIDVHGEFIGAASLFDIIHHCYEGRVGPLYRNPRGTFKILFAEYFNLRNIYSLLVFAKKYKLESKLEIIVLTSNQQMEAEIRGTAQFCLSTVSSLLSSIKFITWDATGRISQALKASNYGYFDYIEYNGGISLDPNYLEHLADLKMMIGKSGVLGVTAFVQNLYQERISSTLRSHYNPDAHIPFSTDTTKLIKEMLITFGLERYTKDNQLLITLANPNTRYFSKNEIVDIIDSLQLRVVSWFPTALMNPYDLLPHEPIQRYKSYGMSEIDFIHTIVSPFRASLYITQSEVLGSANITDLRHFDIGSIVVDRINGVANNFPGAETLAKSSLSLTVNFPFTSQQFPRQAISMTIHPNILGSFGLLSSKPTLQNMLIQNQKTGGASFPIETLKTSLVQSLEFFVLWNYITLWIESDDSPPVATTNQGTVNRVKDQTTTEKLNIRQEHGKSGNSEVLPSGLTFRKAETKKEVKVNEEKSSMKEKINTKDDDIPPICRVPGISGGSFCEIYQSKKSQSQSTSQAPKSSNTKEQKQEKVEDNRIENLKKMGFTENIIKKILAKNEEKSASSNKLETPPKDKDRPAICSLPGVNAESLCRAYEGNARKEKSRAPIERKLPFPEYRPQSRSQLLATFRNPDCMKYSKLNQIDNPDCETPNKFKRTSSGTIVTSKSKVRFDVAQLKEIIRNSRVENKDWPYLEAAYENMTTVLHSLTTSLLSWKSDDAIIVLTSAQKISVGQINNRVIYLAPEISYSEYAQHGALDHITTMMQGIESIDFLVVDGVLIQSVTQPLVQMILYSTIWFDISTGSTFIAHSDDGFIQKAFYELGKEFENSLSPLNSPEPYLLEKYYAVAVNQSTSYSGPITLGDSDYIHVVIWLNGNTTESSHGDEEGNSGIEVMSSDYTSCMINLGIGINARSHPDFASKMGSLKIGILPSCEEFVHEFLGQKYNRLVIFGPGISFRFTSGSTSPSEINHEDANLSDEIIVGVVYVFKRTLLS